MVKTFGSFKGVNKKNITMPDTCRIYSYVEGSSVERAWIYPINSPSLTDLKITGDAAELVDITNNTRYVYKVHPTGTSWYNKWDKATEVYIRTHTTGKAIKDAEGNAVTATVKLKPETSSGTVDVVMGLSDILECLKFAEEKGIVPQLPKKWWEFVKGLYPQFIEPCEVPDDEDEIF